MTLQEWIIGIPAIRAEAKALWGVDYPDLSGEEPLIEFRAYKPHWKFHLDRILKSDNPLEYYEQHKPTK